MLGALRKLMHGWLLIATIEKFVVRDIAVTDLGKTFIEL